MPTELFTHKVHTLNYNFMNEHRTIDSHFIASISTTTYQKMISSIFCLRWYKEFKINVQLNHCTSFMFLFAVQFLLQNPPRYLLNLLYEQWKYGNNHFSYGVFFKLIYYVWTDLSINCIKLWILCLVKSLFGS